MVLFKINAEQEGQGVELTERFDVKGYPTFIVANAEAETISRWWGFGEAGEFIETLAAAVADPTTIAEKQARFANEPNARDAAALGNYHVTRENYLEAVDLFEQAIELGNPDDTYQYDLVLAKSMAADDDAVPVEDLLATADSALESPHLTNDQIVTLSRVMVRTLRKQDPAATAPYIEAGLRATEDAEDEKTQQTRRNLLIAEALLVKGDPQLALALKRDGLPEGWDEDPGALNSFAWWCFENEVNLEEAETLARKAVELAEDDAQKAMILDTVAEIVHLRGDQADAVALIQQAIELDSDNDYYKEQLDRFTGAVAEAAAD